MLTTFLWITGDPPPLLISICPPKPLNQLNRLNLTQHFQNPKKTGTYVVFRGPRARNNISFVTPSLPLAGERGAGGGWRTMCPPSAIDIIGIFGISAIVPTNAPTTAGRFDSPRAAAECRHLRLFLQTRALSLLVIIATRTYLGEAAFNDWGWRVPFLFSFLLMFIAYYIRVHFPQRQY